MGIFGTIVSKIFGKAHAESGQAQPQPQPNSTGATSQPQGSQASAAPISKSQVEAMIGKIASERGKKSNWNTSIVDLLKLLQIDSSLSARKQLAQELGYSGALDGSAEMNIWLHKQVMEKLAESGGKVPDSLRN